jgi:glucose dehydrogenase
MMAQAGRLPDLSADEAAYYAAQPFWFVIATDIALLSALAAAVALFLRGRAAVWLFGLSLVAIFVTNAYDLAAGTSRTLASRGALIVTVIIVVIAILRIVDEEASCSDMSIRAGVTSQCQFGSVDRASTCGHG